MIYRIRCWIAEALFTLGHKIDAVKYDENENFDEDGLPAESIVATGGGRWVNIDNLQPGDAEIVAWRAYANKLMSRGIVSDEQCTLLNTLALAWGKATGKTPHLSGREPVVSA